AHRVLADWRSRHRGRLLAWQIGGSGNAQHCHEPSRYDYDRLHDANPLFVHPARSDAPIPLCLCKTPASTIPPSGSIARGDGSRLFVALVGRKVQMQSVGSGRWYLDRAGSDTSSTRAQTHSKGIFVLAQRPILASPEFAVTVGPLTKKERRK